MTDSALDRTTAALEWFSDSEMRRRGFVARGPEIDYGMRWGARQEVRVSFAPSDDDGNGFLYAFDRDHRCYAVLAASTTFNEVDASWRVLANHPVVGDDYVLMADLLAAPARIAEARQLWRHCVEQEFDARRYHEGLDLDATGRFEAARAVVVARSARTAGETLLIDEIARPRPLVDAPAIVQYRVLDRDDWSGRIPGLGLADAAHCATDLLALADRYGFAVQATSLRHGNVVVAAFRVPELQRVSQPRLPLTVDSALLM